MVGTGVILLISFLIWQKDSFKKVGLKISKKEIPVALLILIIITLGSYWLISTIAAENNVTFVPFFQEKFFYRGVLKTIGQTLNEEIVLGALLLGYIRHVFKKPNPIIISIAVALIFSLFHFLFYYFRISAFADFGVLTFPCLLSLFFAGILRNNCILSTGHIGYAWALHFGWNLAFMDSRFFIGTKAVSEPGLFNLFLGNTSVIVAIFSVMLLSFALYPVYKRFRNPSA